MGGLALILFWRIGDPIASVPIDHYSLVINPVLPTMPLFTLAGYFLPRAERRNGWSASSPRYSAHCEAARRLSSGGLRLFTSFTGGSGVTILALGGLLMTVLPPSATRTRRARIDHRPDRWGAFFRPAFR
jgi:hypothetical protein